MNIQPAIKWSGSKRSQAEAIVARFPREIDTYYEPFCGGASVLRRLLATPSVRVKHFVCSDLNKGLVDLWKEIKRDPAGLADVYSEMWAEFTSTDDIDKRRGYFESVRDEFNSTGSPQAFLFLMRTTTNGMPRYNAQGDFNNSLHLTRSGIAPSRLRAILADWSAVLNAAEVEFRCCPYSEIAPELGDFCYLDPPYAATKGMYYGGIDLDKFFKWLGDIPCRWALSFDGKAGDQDLTAPVPESLYVRHEYLHSGNSSFRRVIGNDRHAEVFESLYLNYNPNFPVSNPIQERLPL